MLSTDQYVSELLAEAIEPPELGAVGRALTTLASMGFLDGSPPASGADGGGRERGGSPAATISGREVTGAVGEARGGVSLFLGSGDSSLLERLDRAGLTPSGRLAAALPIDYRLSRLVALGVQLDCAAEAIVLAAGLALPKPVFRHASPLASASMDEYNDTVRAPDLRGSRCIVVDLP